MYEKTENENENVQDILEELKRDNTNEFLTFHYLKVKLNLYYCIKDMLKNDVNDLKYWFISIEAYKYLRILLAILATIYCMFNHLNPIETGRFIVVAYLLGFIISQSKLLISMTITYAFIFIPYYYVTKFYLDYIAIIIIALITKEYWLLLSFIVARIFCALIIYLVDIIRGAIVYLIFGIYPFNVEITAAKTLSLSLRLFLKDERGFYTWLKEYSNFINSK